MKLKLIENAIDSLEITKDFFELFVYSKDEYKNRYLKLTITFLHNAIELLIKALLIKSDEMIIYEINDTKRINEAKAIVSTRQDLTLEEYLIKDINVKTIGYSDLVSKYLELYSGDEKVEKVLRKIGRFRNAVTHFGIDKSQAVDEVENVIYEGFGIIIYELLDKLFYVDEYFTYNDTIDILEPWYEAGRDVQRKLCVQNPNKNISCFTNLLKKVIDSEKFHAFLNAYEIDLEDKRADYCMDDIVLTFFPLEKECISLSSRYSPFYNATFFINVDTEDIWFAVDHYEEKLYLYDGDEWYNYWHEGDFITRKNKDSKWKAKLLTENNLRNYIISKIKDEIKK